MMSSLALTNFIKSLEKSQNQYKIMDYNLPRAAFKFITLYRENKESKRSKSFDNKRSSIIFKFSIFIVLLVNNNGVYVLCSWLWYNLVRDSHKSPESDNIRLEGNALKDIPKSYWMKFRETINKCVLFCRPYQRIKSRRYK